MGRGGGEGRGERSGLAIHHFIGEHRITNSCMIAFLPCSPYCRGGEGLRCSINCHFLSMSLTLKGIMLDAVISHEQRSECPSRQLYSVVFKCCYWQKLLHYDCRVSGR